MRAFAQAWPDESIVQAPLAQITWYHNLALLEKLKSRDHRLWYARQTIQFGWSRNVLAHQIETDFYGRQGKALTNFDKTLPAPQSELAQQVIKPSKRLKRNCRSLKSRCHLRNKSFWASPRTRGRSATGLRFAPVMGELKVTRTFIKVPGRLILAACLSLWLASARRGGVPHPRPFPTCGSFA